MKKTWKTGKTSVWKSEEVPGDLIFREGVRVKIGKPGQPFPTIQGCFNWPQSQTASIYELINETHIFPVLNYSFP